MKMNYGNLIDFFNVVYSENMSLFIPKKYPWEKEAEKAVIQLDDEGDGFHVSCNRGTRLLIVTDEKITEMQLPFTVKDGIFYLDLRKFLDERNIPYEKGDGRFCNGTGWTQQEASQEVSYCRNGLLDYCDSPYWGEQYQMTFIGKHSMPVAAGRKIKCIRFNDCEPGIGQKAEEWFRYLAGKKRVLDHGMMIRMMRDLGLEEIKLFVEMSSKRADGTEQYDWMDYFLNDDKKRYPLKFI